MYVSPINSTTFNAKIVPTEEWRNYLKYVDNYAFKREGWFDTVKNQAIIDKFIKAVEKNPSDAEIRLDVFYRKNEFFNARGVISSQYGKFTDTEPARSDSNVKIENIIRRILNPENRAQMCKLFGTKNYAEQAKWWDEYIHPMWKDIQEVFYERTLFPKRGDEFLGRDRAWYDRFWNKMFREQNPAG